MLNEPTVEKLKLLRLHAMAEAWAAQYAQPNLTSLSFDERLGLFIDAEWLARENARMHRALKEAKLRMSTACVEDIDYSAKRELDKALIRQLASCRWVAEHQNVIISGKTGTGKTYLACALAQQACRKGYRAIYRRAPRLFQELALGRADGTYSRLLTRIARTRLSGASSTNPASIQRTITPSESCEVSSTGVVLPAAVEATAAISSPRTSSR